MAFQLPDWLKYDIRRKKERLIEWWKQLPLLRWAEQNPRKMMAIAAASVALLLVVTVWLAWPDKPPPVETYKTEWFYDLNTGKLFTAKKGLAPPIDAPSGPLPDGRPAGVRAYVLAYVPEPNQAQRTIAFLETTDPNAPPQHAAEPLPRVSGIRIWAAGKLIRRPQDDQWVPADSPEGLAIVNQAFAPDRAGQLPHYCPPE